MRLNRSLAGTWQFQLDPQGTLQIETLAPDREIPVPLPWQAAFPDLQQYSGYAWYRTIITIEEDWLAGELLLTFGAVDYWCQVFVNKRLVFEHEGGYTPFTIPIRANAQPGENEIVVRVYDSVQANITVPRWPDGELDATLVHHPPFDARNVPHGKQEWYVNVGGIWQNVSLTAVSMLYIERLRITPDIHTGQVEVTVELHGDSHDVAGHELTLQINGTSAEAAVPLVAGQVMYTLGLSIDQPHFWNVDNPYLYTITASLIGPDSTSTYDLLQDRFGFREITTRDGQLLLNDEPLFLLSALDQDLYPDTIYTIPSRDYLCSQFQKAKSLGLNSLRCHIKPPDPLYLELADEMGLLIWTEIPSWRTFHMKTTIHHDGIPLEDPIKARARDTLSAMIRRDYNHPSIIAWTIVNEDWGTALPMSGEDRAWVSEMYDLCKRLDSTRLVVDNSPCPTAWGPNIHVKSDLDDFHIYANIPDQAESFVQLTEQFALRPLWTYSSHGDATRTGQEPLIISEIGNWGLPSLKGLVTPDGNEPDWFNLGPWWASWEGEPGWPAGVQQRFKALGLDRIWSDYEALATATQWHQYEAMKFEIETMRRMPKMTGYVLTEFTDAYWESNGLLDFHRQPKAYHDVFSSINAPDVLIPQLRSYAYWDDDTLPIQVHGSHFSAADWSGATLHWKIGEVEGRHEIPTVPRGEVRSLIYEAWNLPQVNQPGMIELELVLHSASGTVLASNKVPLMLLPGSSRSATHPHEIAVLMRQAGKLNIFGGFSGEGGDVSAPPSNTGLTSGNSTLATDPKSAPRVTLLTNMDWLGYQTSRFISNDTRTVVTDYPDAGMLRWVREGGDMLFLSRGPGPFFWQQGRNGTYGGTWMTSFSWIRPDIHEQLPISNPLTLPYMHIMPTGTVLGLPVEDARFHGDFLAGQVSGWLHHPAVHTVQFRYGKGRVIMTTFGIRQALQDNPTDPAAVAMLHDLVSYLASPDCQPTLTANY